MSLYLVHSNKALTASGVFMAQYSRYITAAALPRWMALCHTKGRIVELRFFAKDWRSYPESRLDMIADKPKHYRWYHCFTPRRNDLYILTAVVAALCNQDDVELPEWTIRLQSIKKVQVPVSVLVL